MNPTWVGIMGLLALFVLLGMRMPVAIVMMLLGVIGITVLNSWNAAMSTLADEAWVIVSNYEFIVIPLFILMGNFASISGMSRDLYAAAYTWFGHWRGGLASATIAACAGFAALSGSSVASAVTCPTEPHARRVPGWAVSAAQLFLRVPENSRMSIPNISRMPKWSFFLIMTNPESKVLRK